MPVILENPEFTSNTTVASDYLSTYGWDTSMGWDISASGFSQHNFGYPWNAFEKNKSNPWVSGINWVVDMDNSPYPPFYIRIKYPYNVYLYSYTYECLLKTMNKWEIQGSNDDINYVSIHQIDLGIYSTDISGSYTIDYTISYKYFKLVINRTSDQLTLNGVLSASLQLNELKLFTKLQEPEPEPNPEPVLKYNKSCCPIKPDLNKVSILNNTISGKMRCAQKIKNTKAQSGIIYNTLNAFGSYQGASGGSRSAPRNTF